MAPRRRQTQQPPAGATARTPQPELVSSVQPVYPPEAKEKGIKGVVILEGRIDTTGKVIGVKVLRSIPALDQAAIGLQSPHLSSAV